MKIGSILIGSGRACGKCGKAEAFFAEAFPSSCENPHQEKRPKATACFADFHSCGIFHRPFFFFGSFFFL